jgi:Winged helix-turn-helix DNA-binding
MRNAIVAMSCLPGITKNDLKVGLVILELTAGHGKLKDRISRSEIARRAGVSERAVTRAMPKFAEAGIIEWTPARAAGHLSTIRLRKAGEIMPNIPGLEHEVWLSRVQPTSELAPAAEGTRDKTVPTTVEDRTEHGTKHDLTRDKREPDAGQNSIGRETKDDLTRDKYCPTTTINTSFSTSLEPPTTSANELREGNQGETPFGYKGESIEQAASRCGVSVREFQIATGLRPADPITTENTHHDKSDSSGGGGVPTDPDADLAKMFDRTFERMHADENGLYWRSKRRDEKNQPYYDDVFGVFSRIWRECGVYLGSGPEWLAKSVIRRSVRLEDLADPDTIDSFIADSWSFQVIMLLSNLEDAFGGPLTTEEAGRVEQYAVEALMRGDDVCDIDCQLVGNPSLWQSCDADIEDCVLERF